MKLTIKPLKKGKFARQPGNTYSAFPVSKATSLVSKKTFITYTEILKDFH